MHKPAVAFASLAFACIAVASTAQTVFGLADPKALSDEFIADIFEQKDPASELSNIKAMVLKMDPSIAALTKPGSEFELALKLRDFVYQRVPVRNDWNNVVWENLDKFVYQALNEEDKGFICAGLAAVYATTLAAFDIPHRSVSMFAKVKPIGDNHVSVEVRRGDQWVAMDPTFNISFADHTGALLSWRDVAELCQTGQQPIIKYGPNTPAKDRSNIDTYYAPVCSLTKYLARSPALGKPFTTVPANWDGSVYRTDGTSLNIQTQYLTWYPWREIGS